MTSPSAEPGAEAAAAPTPGRSVARNTALLMLSQALGLPMSLLINMALGRMLGPAVVGQYYLATTYAGFGFLFVEWGLGGVIPAVVARDRSRAGEVLGSALLWRVSTVPLVAAIVGATCYVFVRPDLDFQISLALVTLGLAIGLVWRTCGDVVRGFERADVAAFSYAGAQVLAAALAIPVIMLGGKLHAFLIATAAASAVVLVAVWRAMRREGVGKLAISWASTRRLLIEGNAFLVLSGVLVLQPTIDAFFLSRTSSDEVIGWHAAAKKLQAALVTPAGALIGALYPTLCRLWVDNKQEFARTTTGALRACTVVMVPLALGSYLFAELGIRLFNKESFGPAEDNLQVLAISVLMVYLSMTIGTCLAASGKARQWTTVQIVCVAVRAVANPLLIPYFQEHYGNGGLGVCWATAVNEVLLVVIGIFLMPRGIFDRSMAKIVLQTGAAGLGMAAVAWALSSVTQFVVAPLAVVVYFVVLYAVGGIEKQQLESIKGIVRRKILRR